MATLICGSLAFDTIMSFEGRFAEQILPDQLHILNVSFLVPDCGATLAAAPATSPTPCSNWAARPCRWPRWATTAPTIWSACAALGISTEFVRQIDDTYTAQAMIMTDRDNNQITAFHPGAMMQAHRTRIEARADLRWASSRPTGAMPCWSTPSSSTPPASPSCSTPARAADVWRRRTGALCRTRHLGHGERLRRPHAVRAHGRRAGRAVAPGAGPGGDAGRRGLRPLGDGQRTHVPAVQPEAVVDPTGCGDAWRGALLYGLEQGWPLARCAALGNRLGALKIASRGPQNYRVAPSILTDL
jgi:adenosine kinase